MDRVLAEAIADYEEDRKIDEARQEIVDIKADLESTHDPDCECRGWARFLLRQARQRYFHLTRHDRQAVLDMP